MIRVVLSVFVTTVIFVFSGLLSGKGLALTGNYTASVVVLNLESEVVSTWLKGDMKLQTVREDGTHPVYLYMGVQRNVAAFPAYREIIVLIPKVEFKGKSYIYMPRLFLDNQGAVNAGRALYGFPKLMSYMENSAENYLLEMDGQELLSANFAPGDADSIDKDNANYKEMKSLLTDEMLLVKGSRVLCSKFILALDDAKVSSLNVDLTIRDGFMKNLAEQTSKHAGLDVESFGAYHMNHVHWRVPNTGRECR